MNRRSPDRRPGSGSDPGSGSGSDPGSGLGSGSGSGAPAGAPASLDDLAGLVEQAARQAQTATSLDQLRAVETEFLGKRGQVAMAQRSLGSLAPDERRSAGQLVQRVRRDVEAVLATRAEELDSTERAQRSAEERLDLTEMCEVRTRGHLHVVGRTRDLLEDVFVGMGFCITEGPEVETDWYNFEALNIPPAHPARGMWDTLYLDLGEPETVLLRTHTSPVQIRHMLEQGPPIYAVMPGRCYRRDTPDMSHIPIFHQVEGLVVDKGITFGDLAGTIEAFTGAYFGPDIHSRLRPAYFPFTEPSAEFDITCTICRGEGCRTCANTGWLELGGAGMVDPAVFSAVGIDPEQYTGFAFGFGIDRCAQMRHEIPDLRSLLENDVRFLQQI